MRAAPVHLTWSAAPLLALCLFVAACGAKTPEVAAPLAEKPGAWAEFTPAPVKIDGKIVTAQCSGAPGADPAFKFWARRGANGKLVVFFDGGGACWSDETCSRPYLNATRDGEETYYSAEIIDEAHPKGRGGVFDLADPRNPLRDWSFVVVPYCTGDVHTGAHAASYRDPATGADFTVHHQGADNFSVVLEWMKANFDKPKAVFVTGSSAGAYGAAFHYPAIRDSFPGGSGAFLGDAGQGVTTNEFAAVSSERWRYQLPVWVFGREARLTPNNDAVGKLAAYFRRDRFAQYTTAHDDVQARFYALAGVGEGADACAQWTDAMTRGLKGRAAKNYHFYLAPGETHTIMSSPTFYEDAGAGARFSDWVAALVSSTGAGWSDRSCTGCLAPVRCPF